MNKLIFAMVFIFGFMACQDQQVRSPKPSETSEPAAQRSEKVELKGSGSEPGWSISITHQTQDRYSFQLITSLGRKTTIGTLSLQSQPPLRDVTTIRYAGQDSDAREISVVYQHKSCLNMAGEDLEGIIVLSWNEQELTGCAQLLMQQ